MQAAIARLLTDSRFQESLYEARPEDAPRLGLDADELGLLRKLDRRKLGISSEGYAGKRFERVEGAFPISLQILGATGRGARYQYLARTAFPHTEDAEHDTFLAYVHGSHDWAPDLHRLLQDTAELEIALFRTPRPRGLPSYRWRPEHVRPQRTSHAITLALRGPLGAVLPRLGQGIPAEYPAEPRTWLALRHGPSIQLEPLDGEVGDLWSACDGTVTLAQLRDELGAWAEKHVQRWLDAQYVVDAAAP